MDIIISHPVSTINGTRTVERHIPYEAARRRIERIVDLSAYERRPAVLSVYAQVFYGCSHATVLPDGRHLWLNDVTGDKVYLGASL